MSKSDKRKCENCGCSKDLHDEEGGNMKCIFCMGHPSSNPECPGYDDEIRCEKCNFEIEYCVCQEEE